MPTPVDLVLIVLFAVVFPVYSDFFHWPRYLRRLAEGDPTARLREYVVTMAFEWLFAAAVVVIWIRHARPWPPLLGTLRWNVRLWIFLALFLLLAAEYVRAIVRFRRTPKISERLRRSLASVEGIVPHTGREYAWFLPLSLTAGICEELLYRGYFIAALQPWLTWWGAAALNVVLFGLAHSYQGAKGILRTGLVGAFMTALYAFTGSLLPAMALHALLDAGSGTYTWLVVTRLARNDEDVPGENPRTSATQ